MGLDGRATIADALERGRLVELLLLPGWLLNRWVGMSMRCLIRLFRCRTPLLIMRDLFRWTRAGWGLLGFAVVGRADTDPFGLSSRLFRLILPG